MKGIKDYYMNFYTLAQSDYFKACKNLQDKYGLPAKPYFKMDSNGDFYKSKAGKIQKDGSITRWKADGLQIHHIREIEPNSKLISKEECAEKCPFEYQMPNELCYCNVLEHLILHIAIEKIYDPDTPSFGSISIYNNHLSLSCKKRHENITSCGLSDSDWFEIDGFLYNDFLAKRFDCKAEFECRMLCKLSCLKDLLKQEDMTNDVKRFN